MGKELVIGVFVIVVIAVHIWLFKWIRFKVDEGVILKCLRESEESTFLGSEVISASTNISAKRISFVCNKSKEIKVNPNEKESWSLY